MGWLASKVSRYLFFIWSSASEVTTLWRYTNLFIIIIIIIFIFLAHQHKACRQLKIKQEMTAVGD